MSLPFPSYIQALPAAQLPGHLVEHGTELGPQGFRYLKKLIAWMLHSAQKWLLMSTGLLHKTMPHMNIDKSHCHIVSTSKNIVANNTLEDGFTSRSPWHHTCKNTATTRPHRPLASQHACWLSRNWLRRYTKRSEARRLMLHTKWKVLCVPLAFSSPG